MERKADDYLALSGHNQLKIINSKCLRVNRIQFTAFITGCRSYDMQIGQIGYVKA